VTDEHLIAAVRHRRPKRPSTPDLLVSGGLAATFVTAAAAFALLVPWNRGLEPLTLAVLVVGYAVLSRVEFEVGPGSAVPIQLVFVPMLFALPVAIVPACVAAGYLVGALPDYLAGRVHPARSLALLSSSWYAIGPAMILSVAPSVASEVGLAAIYGAALLSQFAFDFASSAVRERLAFGHAPGSLLPSFAWIWAVDTLLAPIGLSAALQGPAGVMIVVPFVVLLSLIARDRRVRIDRAVIVDEAYRGALDDVYRDDLSGIANRRKLLQDLERVVTGPAAEHILVFFDLNGFKQYNDTFGHPAGDVMLRRLAGKLGCSVDPKLGSAYRLGGDEFCILAAVPGEDVEALLDASLEALSENGDGFAISACFGSVLVPSEAADAVSALTIADQRLYAQKRAVNDRRRPRLALVDS
jgi:diguanylate cyclase (GGDEF)-like protein